MEYIAKIVEDDGQFCVTFPDVPEAITFGKTFGMALLMAHDALNTAIQFYLEDERPVTFPTHDFLGDNEWAITLDENTHKVIGRSVGYLTKDDTVIRIGLSCKWRKE